MVTSDPFRSCRTAAMILSLLTVALVTAPAVDQTIRAHAHPLQSAPVPPPEWWIAGAGSPAAALPLPSGAWYGTRVDTRYSPWLPMAVVGGGFYGGEVP